LSRLYFTIVIRAFVYDGGIRACKRLVASGVLGIFAIAASAAAGGCLVRISRALIVVCDASDVLAFAHDDVIWGFGTRRIFTVANAVASLIDLTGIR
jgi:hypothetical protein